MTTLIEELRTAVTMVNSPGNAAEPKLSAGYLLLKLHGAELIAAVEAAALIHIAKAVAEAAAAIRALEERAQQRKGQIERLLEQQTLLIDGRQRAETDAARLIALNEQHAISMAGENRARIAAEAERDQWHDLYIGGLDKARGYQGIDSDSTLADALQTLVDMRLRAVAHTSPSPDDGWDADPRPAVAQGVDLEQARLARRHAYDAAQPAAQDMATMPLEQGEPGWKPPEIVPQCAVAQPAAPRACLLRIERRKDGALLYKAMVDLSIGFHLDWPSHPDGVSLRIGGAS